MRKTVIGALVFTILCGPLFCSNVLLFSIDSCRADRFGVYGHNDHTTPNIDRWAKTGTVFTNGYSTSSWTAPGLVSVLTGLYPVTHGVNNRDRMGSPDLLALPKIMKQQGFTVPNLNFFSFAPYYYNLGLSTVQRQYFGKREGDEILNWIRQNTGPEKDEPFFIFYHSTIVHQPYRPSDSELPAPLHELEKSPGIKAVLNGAIVPIGSAQFTDEDPPVLNALYDAEMRRVDRLFGDVIQLLKEKDLLEDTLIVLTADHGEELLDHGFVGHASTSLQAKLYEELIRIPMIFSWPGKIPAGRVDSRLASQIDVMPTMLQLLGLEVPEYVDGLDLMMPPQADRTLYFDSVIAGNQTTKENEGLWVRAMRRGSYKFISSEELYDLSNDPMEKTNLVEIQPQRANAMRKAIQQRLRAGHEKAGRIFQADQMTFRYPQRANRCPSILTPTDGKVLDYSAHTGAVLLAWRGDLETEYLVQYDIGEGAHHIAGVFPVTGNHQLLGPLSPQLWENVKDWNPFKIRVSPRRPKTCWSDWVTFTF